MRKYVTYKRVSGGANQKSGLGLDAQERDIQLFLGPFKTSWEVVSTERVGFEPTRVLPLHDFESCAINRTLPPLHTPLGVLAL